MRRLRGRNALTFGVQVRRVWFAVEKSGTKTFIIRYRADGGGRTAPRRFAAIGRFGPLTVDEARRRVRALLALLPQVRTQPARQAGRRETTMAALIDLYEAEGCFVQRGLRQGSR